MISFWSIADASDSHGSNTLTNNGVSFVVVGPRTVGDFEASESDSLSIASNASLQTGDVSFAFAAAVVPETIAGFRTIVGKWSNTGNLREYLLGINATTSRFEFSVSSNGTAFTTVQANSLGAPSNGSVYYVVAWHDATANTINIQVNNGTVDSAAHSTGVFTSTPTFYIGRTAAQGGVAAYFDGIIGLVGYWKGGFPTSDERTWLWNDGNLRDYAEILAEGSDVTVNSTTGALTLAGQQADIVPGAITVPVDAGALALVGQAADIQPGTVTVATSIGTLAIASQTANVVSVGEATIRTTLSPMGIPGRAYSFEAKTLSGAVTVNAAVGTLALAGQSADAVPGAATITAGSGALSLSGQTADVQAGGVTIYASPSVADGSGNSGLTEGDAVSLPDAVDLCVPGTNVILMDGTFVLTASLAITLQGTETEWISFTAQTPGSVFIEWGSVANDPMFYLLSATGQHCCFIEINGLIFDGMDIATNGIFAQKPSGVTGFHPFALRFINNEIRNCGSAGIATIQADYITCIGNKIHHIGMVRGWGSGIALNTNIWADESPTFHNLILNNIISGVYDCCGQNRIDDPGDDTDITDGNGIIYDRSAAGNISPPVLIANNVIYMNGGRGILGFMAGNMWIINNTCYQNGLDLLLGNDGSGIPDIGDIQIGGTSGNNYVFNNIVYAWTVRHAFALMPSSTAMWRRNLWFGGDDLYGIDPGDVAALSNLFVDENGDHLTDENGDRLGEIYQFINADPDFVDPPVVDPDDGGQYLLALDPDALTDEFYLQSTSPAIDYGIDPRTVTGQKIILPDTSEETDMTDIFAAMTEYLLLDAAGEPRDPGGEDWNLGAYEIVAAADSVVAAAPGALTLAGQAAAIVPGAVTVNADAGAMALAGQSISIALGAVTVAIDAGTLAIAGQAAAVLVDAIINVSVGVLSVVGQQADIVPGAVTVQAAVAELTLTSNQSTVQIGAVTINVATATLTLAGQDATAIGGAVSVQVQFGVLSLAGQTVDIQPGAVSVSVDAGTLGITGNPATIGALAPAVTINAAVGTLTLTGQQIDIAPGAVVVTVVAATLMMVGRPATITAGETRGDWMVSDNAAYEWTVIDEKAYIWILTDSSR